MMMMISPSKKPTKKAPRAALKGASLGPSPIPKDAPFSILIDTREQERTAYNFPEEIPTERTKLEEGDYTIKGFEGLVAVERKTLDDFAQSIMEERFWKEIERVQAKGYHTFIVVIEASMLDIHNKKYTSEIKPASLLGALSALAVRNVPAILCDTRQTAAHYTYSFLRYCWERRYKGVFWTLEPQKEL